MLARPARPGTLDDGADLRRRARGEPDAIGAACFVGSYNAAREQRLSLVRRCGRG